MGKFTNVSVITKKSYDTGITEVVMTFDRYVDHKFYWDILGSFTSNFPIWLNEEFFIKSYYVDEDTNDVYNLEEVTMLIL